MENNSPQRDSLSYQIYQDMAVDLGMPVDAELSPEIRLQLYSSKLIYLENLYKQCFVELNRGGNSLFTFKDLTILRQSLDITQEFLRQTSLECINISLDRVGKRQKRLQRQVLALQSG